MPPSSRSSLGNVLKPNREVFVQGGVPFEKSFLFYCVFDGAVAEKKMECRCFIRRGKEEEVITRTLFVGALFWVSSL